MKDVKQGDMVWVTWTYRSQPEHLKVVKVGRTLAHIDCHGRTYGFRLADGSIADRSASAYFQTETEREADARRADAVAALRAAGIEVRLGRKPALELLEALAEVAKTFTSESGADGRATLTDAGHRALPAGCRCGYVQSRADGHWRLISRRNCPMHSESEAGNE